MTSRAATVEEYLAELPDDRREAIGTVRATVLANLPEGFAEGMQYGMIGYFVPHSAYPEGYHCDPRQPLPYASLASQKNHMALYLMAIYGDPDEAAWFREAWTASGKPLDMGKGCVRFRRIEDVPLDVVAQAIARVPAAEFIARYARAVGRRGSRQPGRRHIWSSLAHSASKSV